MSLFDTHRALLDGALEAIATRGYWSPFPESPSPKVWGETAQTEGSAAAEAHFGRDFPLTQAGERRRVATEVSPWGVELDIRYPDCAPLELVAAARAAEPGWQAAGPAGRSGVLLEALTRIHKRSFEIAHAVMLTTGQGPVMAFQAGGPHAQDRALEAIAYAWKAQADVPQSSHWEKPQGKNPPLSMDKHFEIAGRGIALVIGCATFPTWNTYPGLFAALATGNPVIVKPHPSAVFPAAITVAILRDVLQEQGFDPNVATLALCPDPAETQALAMSPAVASIDYTGGDAFGHWLQQNARHARLYAEMTGVNCMILESTADYSGLLRNLAFSLCLYSGQMCTTSQNLFIPRCGMSTDQGTKGIAEFGSDLAAAINELLSDPKTALAVLGTIVSEAVLATLDSTAQQHQARTVLPSRSLEHPGYPQARVRTPLVAAFDEAEFSSFDSECFGPITFLVSCESRESALSLAEEIMRLHGALTLGLHTLDAEYQRDVEAMALRARVALSTNLTQGVFVNQSAGFSDYHATGGNPAANASYTTLGFVADRFVVVQRRWHRSE